MVLDDAPLAELDAERLPSACSRRRLAGAWNLHLATLDEPLDSFVLFSSIAGMLGNPSQANYAAANAFLDALAHQRRALGLPALAIEWGVLADVGYVARTRRVGPLLARPGLPRLRRRSRRSTCSSRCSRRGPPAGDGGADRLGPARALRPRRRPRRRGCATSSRSARGRPPARARRGLRARAAPRRPARRGRARAQAYLQARHRPRARDRRRARRRRPAARRAGPRLADRGRADDAC